MTMTCGAALSPDGVVGVYYGLCLFETGIAERSVGASSSARRSITWIRFCAGQDLKEVNEAGAVKTAPGGIGGITERAGMNKPLIAAVNGLALGGGMELAMATDIIIASEKAVFGLPEVKVGLTALGGGAQNLSKLVGYHNAMYLAMTGMQFPAKKALELGIVQEIVKPEVSLVFEHPRAAADLRPSQSSGPDEARDRGCSIDNRSIAGRRQGYQGACQVRFGAWLARDEHCDKHAQRSPSNVPLRKHAGRHGRIYQQALSEMEGVREIVIQLVGMSDLLSPHLSLPTGGRHQGIRLADIVKEVRAIPS